MARSLGETALVLVGVARDEGIQLERIRTTWNPEAGLVDVVLLVDTALWRLTPFLMVAAGPTNILQTDEGREVHFSVRAGTLTTQPVSVPVTRLFELLEGGPYRERRVHLDEATPSRRASYRLSATLPMAMVSTLYRTVSRELGEGSVSELEITSPLGSSPRLKLGGPWSDQGSRPSLSRDLTLLDELDDWASARRRVGGLGERPARLRALEALAGKVYLAR